MNILRRFESTISGLVEGGFGRVFRSQVRPMEIARKLVREMDEHRTASVSRVYVPNEYLVWLSSEDRQRYEEVELEVLDELCAYLLEHARREQLILASRPTVTFQTDEHLRLGEFGIQTRLVHSSEEDAEEITQAAHGHTMIYSTSERLRGELEQARAPHGERAFILTDGRRLLVAPKGAVIGRGHNCDIVLDDAGVSRRHAKVTPTPAGWAIEDLHSTNGVRVNKLALEQASPLHNGDHIELGNTEIVFEIR
ncbi:MAG TPA: DUF3662 and FHA domain-containing protein [Solirubrobacteraceae bacterium]|jgi:hypothetical protein